jgi:hypothetical protein
MYILVQQTKYKPSIKCAISKENYTFKKIYHVREHKTQTRKMFLMRFYLSWLEESAHNRSVAGSNPAGRIKRITLIFKNCKINKYY